MPRVSRDLPRHVLTGALLLLIGPGPARADAPVSPRDLPASVDERAQLYGVALGYGALSGYWVQQLSGSDHWAPWVFPGAGAAAIAVGAVAWIDAQDGWAYGQPQAIVTDSLIGTGIAALWVWHDRERSPAGEGWSPALQSTMLWSGATLGATMGWLRYHLSPSPPGQAALTGSTALWLGALSGSLAGAFTPDAEDRARNASLAAAFGVEGGVVLGSWLGRALRPQGGWSLGWVRALDVGALLGAATVGGATVLLTEADLESRATLGAAAAGLTAGIAAAAWLAPRLGWPREGSLRVVPETSATHVSLKLLGELP